MPKRIHSKFLSTAIDDKCASMLLFSPQLMSINTTDQSLFSFQSQTTAPTKKAEPFIKWVGGKNALINQIVPHFPKNYPKYFEPFIGGGAVFFATMHPHAVISDQNEWLIDTYEAVRDNWMQVANALDGLLNTKENFLSVRAMNPNTLDPVTRSAHFIYLNKTCFRGLFRVNRNGQFNVPYGDYDRRYYDPANLAAVSKALSKVKILKGDFEAALVGASKDDFVYFDPPYFKQGGHADFNRYTSAQFRETDQLRLATICNELTERGVKWALSNSDTPFINDLYSSFTKIRINARREINLKSENRNVSELLILNY